MNRYQRWTPALLLTALFAVQSTVSNAEPLNTDAQSSINAEAPSINAAPSSDAQSPSIAAQSPTIGVAASIANAEAGNGINFEPLSPGSELHASETVRTGTVGRADLVFIDRSNLIVGSTSEVLLDKFVYDPVGSAGQVVMQAPHGDFRLVTGTQDNSAYQVKTPYGTLHVRGHE